MSKGEAKALLFGHLRISVYSDSATEIRSVIEMQLAYRELATWLRNNRSAILNETIPIGESGSSSIAEAVARFYHQLNPENENVELSERLYTYRVSHGIRFGQRGTDIPDVYIGLFGGVYEVSFCGESEKWRYEVNLPKFLEEANRLFEESRYLVS